MRRSNARWHWIPSLLLLAAAAPPVPAQTARVPPAHGSGISGTLAAEQPLRLYLEVILNQTRMPQLVPFEYRDGRLHAETGTLRGLGFRLDSQPEGALLALDAIPGTEVRYDASLQRVAIDAPLSQLAFDTTVLGARDASAPAATQSAPGALLNYDLYAADSNSGRSLTASSELRIFGLGRGVLSNTAVTRSIRGTGEDWRGDSVRLDTRWELSFPGPAITATLGDTFTGFLDWSRPVRIGGIQIGRNYALQPYRITTPLPEFLGEATVPSAVELYINGIRQYSGSTPAGPFQLSTVPGVTGAGNAQLVVTDAFGRVRSLDFPFYSTQRLLARGLSDWSLSLGAVREDYGLRSFSYAADPVASGSYRRGISDRFTLEAHAEASENLAHAGVGGVWLLGMAGVLNASHARSSLDGAHGSQTAVGYGWNNQRFNISLDSRRTHGDFRDIASLHGLPPATRSERAVAGFTASAVGNLSLNYVRLDQPGDDLDASRYAGLFWSRSFAGAWSAHLSVNQNLDQDHDRSLYLGVLLPLGRDHQASTSWQRDRGRDQFVVDLARPVPGDGGHGWRLQGRGGDSGGGGLAEIGWQGEYGRLGAGMSRFGDNRHTYAQASGSLVRMGGATFASRDIHDAFAVVSTDGHAGVPVMLENRVVGQTDRRGKLLVSRLNAWQRNKLSIDPMDLPADVRTVEVERIATPSDRSGVHVRFEVAPVRAAVVVLHNAAGRPLPLGSRVRVGDRHEEAITGYDGETYLEALGGHNRLRVSTPQGACSVEFDYPESSTAIPRIGPLHCREERSP